MGELATRCLADLGKLRINEKSKIRNAIEEMKGKEIRRRKYQNIRGGFAGAGIYPEGLSFDIGLR